jgi:FkbH-like protein
MKIKVLSDVVCNSIFRKFVVDDQNNIEASFSPLDLFIPEILQVQNEDLLCIHLSEGAFNSFSVSSDFLNNIHEILSHLENLLMSSNVTVVLNSIFFSHTTVSQNELIENADLSYQVNNAIRDFVKLHPTRCLYVDIASIISRCGHFDNFKLRNYGVMRQPYSKKLESLIREAYLEHFKSYILPRKKVLLLDADNTLWGGVLGEDGVNGVKIGHEFPGNLFYKFQQYLLSLKKSGILLCLVTKNNESDINEIFYDREMPLRLDDFVLIKSNWSPKSQNISEIVTTLNIASSACVFIDDNPFEIEEVKEVFSDIICLKFDTNRFDEFLQNLAYGNNLYSHSVTDEDMNKTSSYAQEFIRKDHLQKSKSIGEYLSGLDIKVTANVNDKSAIPRISQITNKTNQFNLTTKRYSISDIENFMDNDDVYSFSVKDKFGDMGIVGIAIVRQGFIDTFALSCRAFGRKIENAMLATIVSCHQEYPLTATFESSSKNMITKDFYEDNGFVLISETGTLKSYHLDGKLKKPIDFQPEVTWT